MAGDQELPMFFTSELPLQIVTIKSSSPQESWLPITESRNGTTFSVTFHLLCSGIGFQSLLLPLAFASLGWIWGIISLSLAFIWQLYTIWLLVRLHESHTGTRYSRYLQLAITAFGGKLGKLLAIFPVMYLSGGACVMLIITGGGTMKLLFNNMCHHVGGDTCRATSPSGAEWFLLFTCIAIALAQIPNLNSISGVSLIGAITAVGYCTLILVLSISKGRPSDISYEPSDVGKSDVAKVYGVLNALGIIALAFRGHNLVLEIQGTLPTNPKHPSSKPMWRGVTISYLLIALLLFSLAIGGFWSYGNQITVNGGSLLIAFSSLHGHDTSKFTTDLLYLLVVINCICSFQIYAMPTFDNWEFRYTSVKKRRCPGWLRVGLRLLFGGVAFFIAVTFPFLGSLAGLIGGLTLPLAYAYPCFMWIAVKKPGITSLTRGFNFLLGCLGIVLSVLMVIAAALSLADNGLNANFFNP